MVLDSHYLFQQRRLEKLSDEDGDDDEADEESEEDDQSDDDLREEDAFRFEGEDDQKSSLHETVRRIKGLGPTVLATVSKLSERHRATIWAKLSPKQRDLLQKFWLPA